MQDLIIEISSSIDEDEKENFFVILKLIKSVILDRGKHPKRDVYLELKNLLKKYATELDQEEKLLKENKAPNSKESVIDSNIVSTTNENAPPVPPPPPPPPPPFHSKASLTKSTIQDVLHNFDKKPSVKMKQLRWSKLNLANLKFFQNNNPTLTKNVWTLKKFPDSKNIQLDFNQLESLFSQSDLNRNYSLYTRTIMSRLQKNFNDSKRLDFSNDALPTDDLQSLRYNNGLCDGEVGSIYGEDNEELKLMMISGANSLRDRQTSARKILKESIYNDLPVNSILTNQRCLNINIFLSQFKQSSLNIFQLIQKNRSDAIGAEKLKVLVKLMPTEDEEKLLKSYQSHICLLDPAEQFFLQLVKIERFRDRIDNMLLVEEFQTMIAYIKPSLKHVLVTSDALINSDELCKILQLILYIGNFLNNGEGLGCASGFKISSLLKLSDVKSNSSEYTLLHFLAQEVDDHYPELFSVHCQFPYLKEVSESAIDQLLKDFTALKYRVSKMKDTMTFLPERLHEPMKKFLNSAKQQLDEVEFLEEAIKLSFNKLADYFCEDHKQFKAEECFKTLFLFLEQLKKSRNENFDRKQREQRTNLMNKTKNFRTSARNTGNCMTLKSNTLSHQSTPMNQDKTSLLLNRLRSNSLKSVKDEELSSKCESCRLINNVSFPEGKSSLLRCDAVKTVEGSFMERDKRRLRSHSLRKKDSSTTRERIIRIYEKNVNENSVEKSLGKNSEFYTGNYNDSGVEDLSEQPKRSQGEENSTRRSNAIKKDMAINLEKDKSNARNSSTLSDLSEDDCEVNELKKRLNNTLKHVDATESKISQMSTLPTERSNNGAAGRYEEILRGINYSKLDEDSLNKQLLLNYSFTRKRRQGLAMRASQKNIPPQNALKAQKEMEDHSNCDKMYEKISIKI